MRQHLLIFFLLFSLPAGFALATDVTSLDMDEEVDENGDMVVPKNLQLTTSHDMTTLSRLSRDNGVPILLMFSTEDCIYCKRLETEVLGPLRLSGADPKRVILRKVVMDKYEILNDFSGGEYNAENFGIDRGIDVVPTVQLVDATGRELVPKIVGYQATGLYDDYLDKAIEVSRTLLGKE